MRARGLSGIMLVILMAGSVWGSLAQTPADAASPAAMGQSGIYHEDFSTYDAKDVAENMDWNIWQGSLSLSPPAIDNSEQTPCATAVDTDGNLITLWTAGTELWAQKLDPDGNRLWREDVLVASDAAPADMQLDAANVALIAWTQGSDIYAQRLDAAGNLAWPSAIKVTAIEADAEAAPKVAALNGTDLFVVWFDDRNGRTDVYGQRLTLAGNRLWAADRQLASGAGAAWDNEAVLAPGPDGSTVIAWGIENESGNGEYTLDVYAQRHDMYGTRIWASDAYVAQQAGLLWWWTEELLVLNTGAHSTYLWQVDQESDRYIFAQRLNASGQTVWDIPLIVAEDVSPYWQPYFNEPVMTSVVNDGLLVGWQACVQSDWSWPPIPRCNLHVTEISADGEKGQGYGMAFDNAERSHVQLAAGQEGQRYAVWSDLSWSTDEIDAYAQRLDSNWDGKVRINSAFPGPVQHSPALATGDDGALAATWVDNRSGAPAIYVQQWDADYNRRWSVATRVNAGGEESEKGRTPRIAIASSGNIWATWGTYQWGQVYEGTGIRAQRVDTNGNRIWSEDLTVEDSSIVVQYPDIAVDASGAAFVIWHEDYYKTRPWLQAARIDETGNVLWNKNIHDACVHDLSAAKTALDATGNLVAAWKERVSSNTEVLVQKWNDDGSSLGAPSTVSADDQWVPRAYWIPDVAVDGADNILVTWRDKRDGWEGDTDIYVQKLDADGNILWPADVQVNPETGQVERGAPAIAVDAAGNAYVVWSDERSGDARVYMQKLDPAGVPQWERNLCVDIGLDAHDPDIVIDASGNIVVAWVDMRNGDPDIYMQRFNPEGIALWSTDWQVVNPDWAYSASGMAQSRRVNTEAGLVISAHLNAAYDQHGGSIRFFLSNDGGATWEPATSGANHTFATPGEDLRWRVEMEPSTDLLQTPVLWALNIQYNVDLTPTPTPTVTSTPTPLPDTQSVTFQNGLDGYAGASDTWIDEWNPTQNFNWDADAYFIRIYADGHQNGLIRFDLSSIPAGMTVGSATLELKIGSRTNTNPLTVDIYRLDRNWIDDFATWTHRTESGQWLRPGAGSVHDRSTTSEDTLLLNTDSTWSSADVTSLVQYWVDHSAENCGALLQGGAGGGVQYAIRSSDHLEQNDRPKLIVQYSMSTITPTPTATATGTLRPTSTRRPTDTRAPLTATMTPTPTMWKTATPTATPTTTIRPVRGFLPLLSK